MRTCTFFGHSDAPEEIKEKLREAVEDLIVNHGVCTFYMGCEGKFDAYARAVSGGVLLRPRFVGNRRTLQ